MIDNLMEDVNEKEKIIKNITDEINDLRDDELSKHVDLKRELKEMLQMIRSDIGEDILESEIQEAIELPFVSDSDSGEGSAWDSNDDVLDEEGEAKKNSTDSTDSDSD